MSLLVPEYLIGSLLKDGLKYFKDHPELMNQVLISHDSSLIEKAKYLVEKLSVKVVMSYSHIKFSSPAYVIFLNEEGEDINYLGDKITPASTTYATPQVIQNEALDFVPFPFFEVAHKPIFEATLYRNGEIIPVYDYTLNLTTGKGNLSGEYSPLDSYTITYSYLPFYFDPIGAMFNATYRIECLSNNVEEVLILYRLAQFIFLSNRTGLANVGLKKQLLSGEDLEPVALEDQPDFIYRRALYFTFSVEGAGTIPLPALQNIEVHPV